MSVREGELRATPLPLVLQHIAADDGTGILTIQGTEDIVAVSFLDGAIVAADALNQTVEDGLGQVLARKELIAEDDFASLAAEHQGGSGGSLGDLLVRRGLLSREQLLLALREQTNTLLLQLMTWEEGEYKFYAGDEVSYEKGTEPLTVEEVLVGAIAAGDGLDTGAEPPDPEAVYRALPPTAPVRTIGQDADEGDHVLWLTEDEMRLWRLADGVQTAHSVAIAMDRPKLQYALHRLLGLGLIEVVPAAGATSHRVGKAEIFMPPDPTQSRRRPSLTSDQSKAWIRRSGLAAAGLIAAVLAMHVWSQPSSVLLPLPWHRAQRDAYVRQVQQTLFAKIERGAQTFYLMERRHPGSLVDLVDMRLLAPRELTDPSGRPLAFAADEAGYSLTVRGAEATDASVNVEIRPDDWLLSEHEVAEAADVAPLYLID